MPLIMACNPLPIISVIPDVRRLLASGGNLVLSAPPGSGKTTGIPPELLDEPWLAGQKILMLEPRRIAARTAAAQIARVLNETAGETVGYRIRMERKVSHATRIEIVTEGILTRYLQTDPELKGIGLVIFDEFHERSIHADLGLALCLDVQRGLRADLRILVMSATLNTGAVSRILGDAPVVKGEGSMFPVDIRHASASSPPDPCRDTAAAVLKAVREEEGSILVFLPGAREIRNVHRRLTEAGLGTEIVIAPLYGALGRHAQERAIEPVPGGMRKIVLATDIAETSLTIEGIRIVIDAGLMRVPRFDVRSAMTRLATVPVTRDSADQRAGRAGRLVPGICCRLWAREIHDTLLERAIPEILTTDISPLALELAAWGVRDPNRLSWLDPPAGAAFNQAMELLRDLGAIDNRGLITGHGKQMSSLGLHPRLSHMVLTARRFGMGGLACETAAILGDRDFLTTGPNGRDSDLRSRIDALRASTVHGHTSSHGMDAALCRMIRKTADQLKTRLNCAGDEGSVNDLGIVLSFAYADRISVRRPGDLPRYLVANGRGAYFPSPEPLSSEDYLVIADLDGSEPESVIYLAAPVTFEGLSRYCKDLITERQFIQWDRRSRSVLSRRQVLIGKTALKDFPLPDPDAGRVAEAMCEGIRQMGMEVLPWTKALRSWQGRIILMKSVGAEGIDWPDVSDERLLATIETWLRPFLSNITRAGQLSGIDLSSALSPLLSWQHQKALDRLAPTHFIVPSGSRIPIDYSNPEAPVLSVRLQEMFGALETPAIARGAIPMLLHLLSPAGRPVQVTRDLKSFWQTTYFEVKKDLKGRYPKHHWPDNPLEAPPTNRTKKKSRG
jgi:ATP-dependent helicase HrpB